LLGLRRTTLSFATSQRLFGAYGIVTSNVYWYCNRWFGALHRVDASTRHPQTGTAERQIGGLMFTQVNVHGVSRLDQFLKMFVVASDDWILQQIASGIDHVNALKQKNFL